MSVPADKERHAIRDPVYSRQYQTWLFHAGLYPWDIIVCNGKITAIVDWECIGWHPEYWGHTKAYSAFYNMPE